MKKVPINKRWLGKWKIRAVVYAPDGSSILWETDLSVAGAKKIVEVLSVEISKPEGREP
jgi:hypothetical protein